jgi:hypothetical protein
MLPVPFSVIVSWAPKRHVQPSLGSLLSLEFKRGWVEASVTTSDVGIVLGTTITDVVWWG